MKLLGHKTEEMFKRYRIVDEQDLEDATNKLEAYFQKMDNTFGDRVVSIR